VFAQTMILSGSHRYFSNLSACNMTFTKIVCGLAKLMIRIPCFVNVIDASVNTSLSAVIIFLIGDTWTL